MIRIILADDHPIVRRGVRQILAEAPDMLLTGEAQTAPELLALLRTHPCDVVVTDIAMPGRSGLEAVPELKRDHPTLPVLVMSVHPEAEYGTQALQLGAAGYLEKGSVAETLVPAIRKVVAGGRYISAALAERLALQVATDAGRPLQQVLSTREHQVLCLLAAGKSLTEIARELVLSVQTVSTFKQRTQEKMGLTSTGQLLHYAIRHRLLEGPRPAPAAR